MICFPYSSITKHNNILFLSGSRGMVRRSSDVLAICCRHAGPRCLLGNPSLGLVILWERFSQFFYLCFFCALQLQLLSKSRSSHSIEDPISVLCNFSESNPDISVSCKTMLHKKLLFYLSCFDELAISNHVPFLCHWKLVGGFRVQSLGMNSILYSSFSLKRYL